MSYMLIIVMINQVINPKIVKTKRSHNNMKYQSKRFYRTLQ